jgi:hypothetical protein
MVLTTESLGLIFLLVSAAALGMSLVHDVGKLSAAKARSGLLQRQTDKKKALANEWRGRIDGLNRDLRAQQARFTEFNGKKQKLQTDMRELDQKKVEFVHELGELGEGTAIYWSRLRPSDAFKTVPRQDVVFSRQIWDYRNVAHISAFGPDRALVSLAGVFGVAGGVRASELVPLALAPQDDEDEQAAENAEEEAA